MDFGLHVGPPFGLYQDPFFPFPGPFLGFKTDLGGKTAKPLKSRTVPHFDHIFDLWRATEIDFFGVLVSIFSAVAVLIDFWPCFGTPMGHPRTLEDAPRGALARPGSVLERSSDARGTPQGPQEGLSW